MSVKRLELPEIDNSAPTHNSVLSTNKPSVIRRHNQFNIHNTPSHSDSAFFTSFGFLITSFDRLLLLRQPECFSISNNNLSRYIVRSFFPLISKLCCSNAS